MNNNSNPEAQEAVLKIRTDGQNRRFILVADELMTIGRGSSCAIQIQDQSVSRKHCVAVFSKGKVCINDLYSTHGLSLNGQRVDRCELMPGESCKLGHAIATFEAPATPTPKEIPKSKPPSTAPAPVSNPPKTPSPSPADEDSADEINTMAAISLEQIAPKAIAGYRILEKIGEGGFAHVFRAEQVQLHRQVALKILKRKESDEGRQQRIAEFMTEARLAASLSDPRLVQIYDVGESNGDHFLSMELVEGGSLARQLRRDGAMPWQDVIRLLRDVGQGLIAAHAAGLVHRDVKPGNILMTKDGQAKLTDLGLAVSEAHAGTLAFMAPEQLRREALDPRTDIYGLGCTAYAALSGNPPFMGDRKEIAQGHLKQKPEPLLDRSVQVPWHLHQLIIDSMMAKNPEDRPQDVKAMITRLDRMILPTAAPNINIDEDEDDYPSVAPTRLGKARGGGNPSKAFWARLTGDAIVFSIVGLTVIGLLLALKVVWPHIDIYRLIGK